MEHEPGGHSIAVLLHAGRLSIERVAMAAHLGDQRALAAGVGAWTSEHRRDSAAATLLAFAELDPRERVWLAGVCAARALKAFQEGMETGWEVLRLARGWCLGEVPAETLLTACEGMPIEPGAFCPRTSEELALEAAYYAGLAAGPELDMFGESRGPERACNAVYSAESALRDSSPAEAERQAQAIASALLDPDWPPWEP